MAKSKEIIKTEHKGYDIVATYEGYTISKGGEVKHERKSVGDPDTGVQCAKMWINDHA